MRSLKINFSLFRYFRVFRIPFFILFLSTLFAPMAATAQTDEITGRVVTEDGTGLPNVMVSLSPIAGEGRATTVTSRPPTTSDEEGNFKFTGLAAGSYIVNVANSKGYVRKSMPVNERQVPTYNRPGDNVTVTMVKGGVITGRVTNMNGEP